MDILNHVDHLVAHNGNRVYHWITHILNLTYDWISHIWNQFWQYLTAPPDLEARARWEAQVARERATVLEESARYDAEDARERARLREHYRLNPPSMWEWGWANVTAHFAMPALFIVLCLAVWENLFSPSSSADQQTTALVWTLDTTSPYHVIASLPGEAFTYAQVTKLDIGWQVVPFPAEFDMGGWRGRPVDTINFHPFQDKLDPHYYDLVAKQWPDNRGVGVALGQHAGIVEFVATLYIYHPDTPKPTPSHGRSIIDSGGGALIERVAIAPGAQGGDRLSLPRLLKEGWVVIGKEERVETKEAAKQSKGEENPSSSGGYAWDGPNEFEGHDKGGWKTWTANPKFPFNMFLRGNPQDRGDVPVLTLRHRPTGLLLKAFLKGDRWVVNTLVEDNRPKRKSGWKRIF